jgi:hypothetical protein
MKKLTAYRIELLVRDLREAAKVESIIKEYGNVIYLTWTALFGTIDFVYEGNKTKYELQEELMRKMQEQSIQAKITELKETSIGKLADPKYEPKITVTATKKKSEKKDN